jgi:hypothetical protein
MFAGLSVLIPLVLGAKPDNALELGLTMLKALGAKEVPVTPEDEKMLQEMGLLPKATPFMAGLA